MILRVSDCNILTFSFWQASFPANMASRKASACSAKDVQKVFRGNRSAVAADALLSLDAFCSNEVFFGDLQEVTERLTSKLLCEASEQIWPGQSPLEHNNFNKRVNEVVKVLFDKARSMTTGHRPPDSVSSMCTFIKATFSEGASASPCKRQLAIMDDPSKSKPDSSGQAS